MKIYHAFGNLMIFKFKRCLKSLSFFLFALLSEKKEEKILCALYVSSEPQALSRGSGR
ncbi:hypothetical protein ACFL0O_04080 [Thermodesulfobacteriota bacterium]